jgi:hypothetical protein
MARTEIAGFRPKSYKNLQAKARETANLSNEIRAFRIIQAELIMDPVRNAKVGTGTLLTLIVISAVVMLFSLRKQSLYIDMRVNFHTKEP